MKFVSGLENFENEISHLVHNEEQTIKFPWIGNLIEKFEGIRFENFDDLDGFEPPMLDETWGLHENQENSVQLSFDETFLIELDSKYIQHQITGENSVKLIPKLISEIDKENLKCRSKLWRCLSFTLEGGLKYFSNSTEFKR